jgi:hypothetical protein
MLVLRLSLNRRVCSAVLWVFRNQYLHHATWAKMFNTNLVTREINSAAENETVLQVVESENAAEAMSLEINQPMCDAAGEEPGNLKKPGL